jgi:hypothetical protein
MNLHLKISKRGEHEQNIAFWKPHYKRATKNTKGHRSNWNRNLLKPKR